MNSYHFKVCLVNDSSLEPVLKSADIQMDASQPELNLYKEKYVEQSERLGNMQDNSAPIQLDTSLRQIVSNFANHKDNLICQYFE